MRIRKTFLQINTKHILLLLLLILIGIPLLLNIINFPKTTKIAAEGDIKIYTIEDLNAVRDDLDKSYLLMNDLDFEEPSSWEDYEANYDSVMNVIPAGTVIENEYLGKASLTSYNVDYPPIGSISSITVSYCDTVLQPFELGITAGWEITNEMSGEISFFDIDGNSTSPDDILELPWLNWYSVRITYSLGEKIHWGWEPIGTEVTINWRDGSIEGNGFTGTFDGNGYEIRNLYIYGDRIFSSSPKDLALFTYLQGGKIDNVKLINADIQSTNNPVHPRVATLVVYNSGTIENSFSSGNVSGRSEVGGLVAYSLSGNIKNSNSRSDIYGMYSIGGLAGKIKNSVILNSFSSGEITCEGGCGGLVGISTDSSTITNSYATGNVVGERLLGGLVGSNYDSIIEKSYALGDVIGEENEIGGLIGKNHFGTITNSYATGNVSGDTYVGGFVGVETSSPDWGVATIYNSYSTGNVIGNHNVGGFSGYCEGTIYDSYSTGDVTGNTGNTGAFSGHNRGSITASYTTGNVYYDGLPHPTDKGFVGNEYVGTNYEDRNNFFDSQASNQLTTTGNATPKNTTEMKSISTYTTLVLDQLDEAWDILPLNNFNPSDPSIWYIDNGVEYPKLSWQYYSPEIVTISPTGIGINQAKLKGNLVETGEMGSVQVYFQYRKLNDTWEETEKISKTSSGEFSKQITNLTRNSQYFFRTVVIWGNNNIKYGETLAFVTKPDVTAPYIKIKKIGLISNILDSDSLLYFFTSTKPKIQGTTEANSTVYFEFDDNTYSVQATKDGDFTITLTVSRGRNEIEYYSIDPSGNRSEIRELTLIVGTENFPDWLLEKLGLIDSPVEEENDPVEEPTEEIEVEDGEEGGNQEEDIDIPPVTNSKQIKFTDKKGNPLAQAVIKIEGNTYITDSEGAIEIEDFENRKYVAEVTTKDGKIHNTDILGVGSGEEIIIEIDDGTGMHWKNIIIYSGIGLILLIVILFAFSKRKQTSGNY